MAKSFDHTSLLALGCIWLVALFLYILTNCISPLLPDLMVDFHLSHSMGGFLYALPILMIALFSYPLGIFSDRIGMEASIGYGATIAILSSLLRSFTTSFDLLVASTAAFGLGFAFCLPNLPKFVKERFSPQLSGTATGVYTTAIPFGTGFAMVFARPILALTGSWRNVLLVWSLTALPTILLWWIVSRLSIKRRAQPQLGNTPEGIVGQAAAEPIGPEASQNPSLSAPNLKKHALGSPFPPDGLWVTACASESDFLLHNRVASYVSHGVWMGRCSSSDRHIFHLFCRNTCNVFHPSAIGLDREKAAHHRVEFFVDVNLFCYGSRKSVTKLVRDPRLRYYDGRRLLTPARPSRTAGRNEKGRPCCRCNPLDWLCGALIGPPAAGYLRDLTGNFATAFLATALVGLAASGLSYKLPRPFPTEKQEEETAG